MNKLEKEAARSAKKRFPDMKRSDPFAYGLFGFERTPKFLTHLRTAFVQGWLAGKRARREK